ncbi:hypothetical protein XENTR_v10009821 [Xenopus tropicalis]|uniref:Olfactory receptor n=1 Tax=Xenopus tropicalis TaxID=8364 RepID=A0A8J0QLA4_XENTR|nr:olfactory receptor 8U9-like [Xenopus tropicalis]KAE8619513.1 hypothetical protein XENTR_v10009821 [Xenopus tropicalis]|eukprot:XP_002932831.1 PREDICTED: olfactory receptor 8U9-like [Xenopus tropicalis]
METNQSLDIFFLFDGLTDDPELETALFIIILLIYIFTIVGNCGLIVMIMTSPILHTPMYSFLKHLAFIDMCYTSVVTPRTLSDLFSKKKDISFMACAVQMYFYAAFFGAEILLLAAMAYDRYAAICRPLVYHIIIKREVCRRMIIACYAISFLHSFIHTKNIFSHSYCNNYQISHFFCDAPPVLKLSCSDTSLTQLLIFAIVGVYSSTCASLILTSYIHIFSAILRIKSTQGRQKAFTTCSSHLVSIGTLFGTMIYMYLHPNASNADQDKVVSVFYTMVIPMLNPIIYSLRNKDVRRAFEKLM